MAGIKMISATAPALILLQAGVPDAFPWISQMERAGLLGALFVAVWILWRALGEKDKQIVTSAEHVAASLAAQVETNRELRRLLEESVAAKRQLAESIEQLRSTIGRLPCSVVEDAKVSAIRR